MGLFNQISKLANLASSVENASNAFQTGKSLLDGVLSQKPDQQASSKPDQGLLQAVSQPQTGSRYSESLENMIAMVLENDEIDERDIELLSKRAAKEGVDPDEFEFTLRMRIKKKAKQQEEATNRNPIDHLSKSLKMMEQYAVGGENIVAPEALTGVLTLVPGVGQVAAVGGLLSTFIKTPSNLNSLKAEVIRSFILPDDPNLLAQFITYAASQLEECNSQYNESVSSFISSLAFGSDVNLTPIWEKKIEEASLKAKVQYPNNAMLMQTVKAHQPSLIKKLRAGKILPHDLDTVLCPEDDEELLLVIEFAFAKVKGDDYNKKETWVPFHKRMYREGEHRFANNPELKKRLMKYKVKLFGLF